MKTRHYIIAVLLIPILILVRFVAEIGDWRHDMYIITDVIDGDTIELNENEKLRLLGIDTPEHDEPHYESAKEFLTGLVLGKQVRLQFGLRKRGGHRRLLAYVYLDSIFVNAEVLRSGNGWLYLFPDNKPDHDVLSEMFVAQRQAMAEGIGVWALPYYEEDYYVANSYRMRFHRPECPSVKKLAPEYRVIFDKREEAFYEGYSPCRNCKP